LLDLHFDKTPNCWKVAIMLEEVGAAYKVINYEILRGDHLTPAYGEINPNHKLPAIVDHEPQGGGEPIKVAESAAILIYLAEKHRALLPGRARERAAVLQWLAWQVAGLGPMMGQASHFMRYAPGRHEYSIARYSKEAKRLMQVLDGVLGRSTYVGHEYSIADIAIWPWAAFAERVGIGIELANFPNVKRWSELVGARPAIAKVFSNAATAIDSSYLQQTRTLTQEEWSNVCGDRMFAASARRQQDGRYQKGKTE
jgi:GSH-dependent disulfide-bond oxidoreductase